MRYQGSWYEEHYTVGGEHDAAIDQLAYLLSVSFMTVSRLKLRPIWDPLREHPGLLTRYSVAQK